MIPGNLPRGDIGLEESNRPDHAKCCMRTNPRLTSSRVDSAQGSKKGLKSKELPINGFEDKEIAYQGIWDKEIAKKTGFRRSREDDANLRNLCGIDTYRGAG